MSKPVEIFAAKSDGFHSLKDGHVIGSAPAARAMLLGGSYTTSGDESLYSNPKVARIYFGGGKLVGDITTNAQFQEAYAENVRVYVVSSKDDNPTLLGQMTGSFPSDCTRYVCVHHEPENDSGTSAAQWAAMQATNMPQVRAHGGIPTAILMSFTLNPSSGRNFADWILPAGTVDALGFDYYPSQQAASSQTTVVNRIKAALTQAGVSRSIIGEYGVLNGDPTTGVTQVNEFKTLIAPVVEAVCYWSDQTSASDPNYKLTAPVAAAFFGS